MLWASYTACLLFLIRTPVVESFSCQSPGHRVGPAALRTLSTRVQRTGVCGREWSGQKSLDSGNRTPDGCGFTDLLEIVIAVGKLYSLPVVSHPDTSRRRISTAHRGSNPGPSPHQDDALPTELWPLLLTPDALQPTRGIGWRDRRTKSVDTGNRTPDGCGLEAL